jgi:hypothetical protein
VWAVEVADPEPGPVTIECDDGDVIEAKAVGVVGGWLLLAAAGENELVAILWSDGRYLADSVIDRTSGAKVNATVGLDDLRSGRYRVAVAVPFNDTESPLGCVTV